MSGYPSLVQEVSNPRAPSEGAVWSLLPECAEVSFPPPEPSRCTCNVPLVDARGLHDYSHAHANAYSTLTALLLFSPLLLPSLLLVSFHRVPHLMSKAGANSGGGGSGWGGGQAERVQE